MKNTYIKPTSQSISLLFGADVAETITVGSEGQSGAGNYTRRHDWEEDDFAEGWDDEE